MIILRQNNYTDKKKTLSVFHSQAWDDLPYKDKKEPMMVNGKKGRYEWVDKDYEDLPSEYTSKENEAVSKEFDKIAKKDAFPKHHKDALIKEQKQNRATGSGHGAYIGRHRNPFKNEYSIQNFYDAKSNGHTGRDMFISGHTKGKSAKEFYKDYLTMENHVGMKPGSGDMSHKEVKDTLRKIAKRKKIEKGAIIAGGTALAAGTLYAGKKAYDHYKNKRKNDNT